MPGKREGAASPEVHRAAHWLNSYSEASKWMGRYNLHQMLDENGGLIRIENFLPPFVAEGVLQVLRAIPTDKWNATAAGEDYAQNNISHQFLSIKHASAMIDAVVRVVGLLLPGQLNAFSAARYDRTHHIAPHDDRAYTPVQLDTGEVITCSREIGVIWYLTQDWREEFGGALVDLEAQGGTKTYVPLFNSVVAFRVPRYHEVTPLTTSRPRYSLFGWFLQPGKRYELYTGDHAQAAAAAAAGAAAAGGAAGAGGRLRLGAGGPAAAGGGGQKKKKEGGAKRRKGSSLELDGGDPAPHACKLAQRIAASAAKRRRQRGQGQQQEEED